MKASTRTVVASGLGTMICGETRQASRTVNPYGLAVECLEVVVGTVVAAAVSRHSRIVDDRLEESDKSGTAMEW